MKEFSKPRKLNILLDWFIYIVGYAVILIAVTLIFKKTIYIDNSLFGLWGIVAAVLIFLLNKTIKPLLVWLTLPITALTLGMFYPFINVFILKMVDFIMGSHFTINGLFMPFIVACIISFMNILMDELVIGPILRKED